eukprot:TRINITY_DN4420_c0_g1_i2.p1 TRINITY_DN4420_c0_g1~~TRINITY_DN4420_c0_g1_i2.p1  ORF type:complete len:433 (+),score=20.56 TRINITY_DN4420_c0_g1_i2:131-1429(+)
MKRGIVFLLLFFSLFLNVLFLGSYINSSQPHSISIPNNAVPLSIKPSIELIPAVMDDWQLEKMCDPNMTTVTNQIDQYSYISESCKKKIKKELTRDLSFALEVCRYPQFPIELDEIKLLHQNCNRLRNRHPVQNKTEILFLILSHVQPKLIDRTIKKLQSSQHAFIIHVDKLENQSFINQMYLIADQNPNVCLAQSGEIVYLSGTDMQQIVAIQHWAFNDIPFWDFFIPLTGQDYPLFNGTEINKIVETIGNKTWYPGHSNIDVCRKPPLCTVYLKYRYRFVQYTFSCISENNHPTPVVLHGRPNWLFSQEPYFNYVWGNPLYNNVFHRDMIEYLLKDNIARKAFMFFGLLRMAAVEHYWATIFNLPNLKPPLHQRTACVMSWIHGKQYSDSGDGVHNLYFTLDQIDLIQDAWKECTIDQQSNRSYLCDLLR